MFRQKVTISSLFTDKLFTAKVFDKLFRKVTQNKLVNLVLYRKLTQFDLKSLDNC